MKLLWWSDPDRREPVGPVNGRNRSPTGWSRPADCRTCPTLRNLFPTSPSSFSPISPFFSSSSFAFWDQTRLPAVRITRLPPSSPSFRQLQLFQWTDHTVFFTSFTPSVNAPGDQQAEARGASTFHHGGLFGKMAAPNIRPLLLFNWPGFLPGLLAMPRPTSGRE